MDNVIDFMSFKKERDRAHEEMETEIMRESVMNWMCNPTEYTPDTFTFTLEMEDE